MNGIGMLCLDGDGRVLWKLRTEERNVRPRALVKSKLGGFTRNLVVHLHAALIGVVHGPRMLWRNAAPGQFQATPLVLAMQDGTALVAEIVAKGDAGAALEAFEGKNGGKRWAAEGSFYPNRGATLADLDGDGAAEIVAFGRIGKHARDLRKVVYVGLFALAFAPLVGVISGCKTLMTCTSSAYRPLFTAWESFE